MTSATGPQDLTTTGNALGTPSYMSPEQASADPNIDHRTDIYAMGALGYELLAGRPPFLGASAQEILAAHLVTEPAPVSSYGRSARIRKRLMPMASMSTSTVSRQSSPAAR